MQPPTPTKNHRPATKARTFVLANAAMLAEQEVVEYQQTPYEILRFVHQDASGSGVQQTLANGTLAIPNARTAEYDAMGRNVADPGPYITLDSAPSDGGPGIDLFGNGEGYRPGRSTYKVNGFVVPESTFMMHIGSFTFDLIQVAARMSRMSVRDYSVRVEGENGRIYERFFGSQAEAESVARSFGVDTIYKNILVNDSWSVIASLIPARNSNPSSSSDTSNATEDDITRKLRISEMCIRQAKSLLGTEGWQRALALLRNPPLIDIESTPSQFNVELSSISEDSGILYFGSDFARPGESVGSAFERGRDGLVWAVRGGALDGIYYRSSESPNFLNGNFLLHEVLHMLWPVTLNERRMNLDEILVRDLSIVQDDGMSASAAVSRFFNSGCDPEYGGILLDD